MTTKQDKTTYWPRGIGFVTTKGEVEKRGRVHHVWIIDESGSMYWAVKKLADDLIAHLKDIQPGDILSIGWFSSPGEFRWIIIGISFAVDPTRRELDRERLVQVIRDNVYARNTTCMSEILADLPKVLEQTRALYDSVNMAFLTDGHPVVPDPAKEEKNILAALEAVKSKLSQALFVGYGEYYNRSLMAKMAAAVGGTLQHADQIEKFGVQLGELTLKARGKRVTVKLPGGVRFAFTFDGGSVSVYQVEKGSVDVPEGTTVYFETSGDRDQTPKPEDTDPLAVGYAAALAYVQQEDTDAALKELGAIGDVALVKALGNALTNDEFGRAQDAIKAALVNPAGRFVGGRKIGCVPPDDTFDLLDLMELLHADKEAGFLPYDDAFNYKRIGRKSDPRGNFPPFVPDKTTPVPFASLTWNSTELNLSVLAPIKGTVEFPDAAEAAKVGFAKVFPAMVWRNYALVANCYPNVTILPVRLSRDSFDTLTKEGLILPGMVYLTEGVYTLDLTAIPVCNREKSKAGYNAQAIARKVVAARLFDGVLHAMNALRKELDPTGDIGKKKQYTPEQEAFLEKYGIKDGVYDPPTDAAPTTDVQTVRVFECSVDMLSSWPKLDDVRAKISKGKSLSPRDEITHEAMQAFENDTKGMNLEQKLAHIDKTVEIGKQHRDTYRREINTARFAMALGGKWFDGMKRDQTMVTVDKDGKTYTVQFNIDTKEKKI